MQDPENTLLETPPATPTPPETPPVAPPAIPPVTPAPVTSISPVKPDLTFTENWREQLPEDIRGDKSLDVIKTLPDLAKRMVNAIRLVGKDKVAIPSDKAKPEEWNAFYDAIGRPKGKDGYKAPEIPEELNDIFTTERLTRAKERAHALGATQKQFDEFMKGELEEVQTLLAEQDRIDKQAEEDAQKAAINAQKDTEKQLRQEWGLNYDENMQSAQRFITEAIPDEEERMEFRNDKSDVSLGNNPHLIRLFSKVGARMREHTNLIAKLTNKMPMEIQGRIKELQNTPGYLQINSKMTAEERDRITNEIRELTKQLNPEQKK